MSNANKMVLLDSAHLARDLGELRKLGAAPVPPPDAMAYTRPDTSRRLVRFAPWLYDFTYGWTPAQEGQEPRPPVTLPPYVLETFPLRTRSLPGKRKNTIVIDLRRFPTFARVFLLVPTAVVGGSGRLSGPRSRRAAMADVAVAESPDAFNAIFGKHLSAAVTAKQTLLEVSGGRRAILDDLTLPAGRDVVLEVYAGVLRDLVKPKTYYVMHLDQFIDGRLMGGFDHIFQSYHQYDVPVVGDQRIMVAYRRSSAEVSRIPPMALVFFDSWDAALAAGYSFSPLSYGLPLTPGRVPPALVRRVLAFFNRKALTVAKLVQAIHDDPAVDEHGRPEKIPTVKKGLDKATAERILAARAKLGPKGFTTLAQIDAVKGVGPDTMNDILGSFVREAERVALAAGVRPRGPGVRGDWHPDPEIVKLLARRR